MHGLAFKAAGLGRHRITCLVRILAHVSHCPVGSRHRRVSVPDRSGYCVSSGSFRRVGSAAGSPGTISRSFPRARVSKGRYRSIRNRSHQTSVAVLVSLYIVLLEPLDGARRRARRILRRLAFLTARLRAARSRRNVEIGSRAVSASTAASKVATASLPAGAWGNMRRACSCFYACRYRKTAALLRATCIRATRLRLDIALLRQDASASGRRHNHCATARRSPKRRIFSDVAVPSS